MHEDLLDREVRSVFHASIISTAEPIVVPRVTPWGCSTNRALRARDDLHHLASDSDDVVAAVLLRSATAVLWHVATQRVALELGRRGGGRSLLLDRRGVPDPRPATRTARVHGRWARPLAPARVVARAGVPSPPARDPGRSVAMVPDRAVRRRARVVPHDRSHLRAATVLGDGSLDRHFASRRRRRFGGGVRRGEGAGARAAPCARLGNRVVVREVSRGRPTARRAYRPRSGEPGGDRGHRDLRAPGCHTAGSLVATPRADQRQTLGDGEAFDCGGAKARSIICRSSDRGW